MGCGDADRAKNIAVGANIKKMYDIDRIYNSISIDCVKEGHKSVLEPARPKPLDDGIG